MVTQNSYHNFFNLKMQTQKPVKGEARLQKLEKTSKPTIRHNRYGYYAKHV